MVARQSNGRHSGVSAEAYMDGRAALLLAQVRECNASGVRDLLTSGVDANSRDALSHDGATALYVAVCLNSQDIVFLLLHFGADLNAATSWGNRPIHAAADLGLEVIITLLLKHNDHRGRVIEVNARNKNGDTALHLAASRGHLRICKTLLSHKADPSALNNRSRTARDEASLNGKSVVFQELHKYRHGSEDLGGKNPSTAPIQRKLYTNVKGRVLMTEPVCLKISSRRLEPVESEDTSISTSNDSSISTSSDSSLSDSASSSPSFSISPCLSSSSSTISSPSTSIALSASTSGGKHDLLATDVVADCFDGETSQKQPFRTESVKAESPVTESATTASVIRTNSSHQAVDSGHLDIYGQPKGIQRAISAHDDFQGTQLESDGILNYSESMNNSPYAQYFEQIQWSLVRRERQLKIEMDKNEMLQKKMAEMKEENAILRTLLKGKSLSRKVESHNIPS